MKNLLSYLHFIGMLIAVFSIGALTYGTLNTSRIVEPYVWVLCITVGIFNMYLFFKHYKTNGTKD